MSPQLFPPTLAPAPSAPPPASPSPKKATTRSSSTVEASDSERVKLTTLVQTYLNARAAGNWAQVCFLLAAKPRAEQLRFAPGAKSCAQAMAYFAKDANPAILREEARIEVLSLRVDPPIAFLIYRRSDQSIWATALEREGGEWKVISVTPAPVG